MWKITNKTNNQVLTTSNPSKAFESLENGGHVLGELPDFDAMVSGESITFCNDSFDVLKVAYEVNTGCEV